MKKLLFLFFIICSNSGKGQSVYFSYPTEKLQAMKEEAVKVSNYDKAAYIKKELDKRTAEKNRIVELQSKLDTKVQSENYEEAAAIKEELNHFKEAVLLKDSLRDAIELAVKTNKESSVLKNKLKDVELKMLENEKGKKSTLIPEKTKEPEIATQQVAVEITPKKYNYIEKVREVQKADPTVSIYLGNGWLAGRSIFNPLIGLEFRFSRKNVFMRGFSLGVRGCTQNVLGDGDNNSGSGNLRVEPSIQDNYESAGGVVTLKYFAPIPLKKIQPYIISMAGLGAFTRVVGTIYWNSALQKAESSYAIYELQKLKIMVGSGIGCNFLLGKHFGFFIEAGYFRMSLINTGLVFKR